MPESMPAGGYLSDYLLFWYVVATLVLFALTAWRAERRVLAIALTGAGCIASVLLIGETSLRYLGDAPNDGLPTLTSRAWYLRHWKAEQNTHGVRGDDWEDAAPGVGATGDARTIVLGDDVVAGYGVADFDECVGPLLGRLHPELEVVGVGVPTWNTGQQLQWLAANAATLGATRVLLVYSADDAVDLLPPEQQLDVQTLSEERSTVFNPARSFVGDRLWFRSMMDDSPWWADRVALRGEGTRLRQEERMRRITNVCARIGVPLDVAIVPWPGNGESERAHRSLALDMWRRVGARRVVDLAPRLDPTQRVSRWAPWPDEGAHAALAALLSAEFFRN